MRGTMGKYNGTIGFFNLHIIAFVTNSLSSADFVPAVELCTAVHLLT